MSILAVVGFEALRPDKPCKKPEHGVSLSFIHRREMGSTDKGFKS
jgi:hypothetical protein